MEAIIVELGAFRTVREGIVMEVPSFSTLVLPGHGTKEPFGAPAEETSEFSGLHSVAF